MTYTFLDIYNQLKSGQPVNLKSKLNLGIFTFSIKPFLEDINISEINENNFKLVFDEIIKQNNNAFTNISGYSFNLLALCCAYRPDFPEYVFEYLSNSMNLKNDSKHTNYLLQVAIDNRRNVNIGKGTFSNSFFLYEKYKLTPLKKNKSKIFYHFFSNSIDINNPKITPVFLKLINFNFAKDNDLFNPYTHSAKTIEVFNYYIKDYILKESELGFENPDLKAVIYTKEMFDFLKKEIDYHILFDYHIKLSSEYSSFISKAPMDIILSHFLSINDDDFQKKKVIPFTHFIHSAYEKRYSNRENPVQSDFPDSYQKRLRVEEKFKIKAILLPVKGEQNKIAKKRI